MNWDDGKPEYNEKVAGTYQFTGTLEQLGEIQNPTNKQAEMDVIVDSPIIVEVADLEELGIPLIIEVANGTKRSELGLPEKVKVVLNNGETTEVDVTWDDGNPPYDEKKAGTYTFTGTLLLSQQQGMFSMMTASIASIFTSELKPSHEIQNPHQLTVSLDVEVQEPYLIEVESLDRIHVDNGTEKSEVPLPESVDVILNNGETLQLFVEWNESEPKYESRKEGAYRFTGTFELVDGVTNLNQLQPIVEVVVGEPHIIEVEKMGVITVENGTTISDLLLPRKAKVILNNGGVLDVEVTWEESEPPYDGMQAGTYTFKGTLEQINGIKNPQNMNAIVEVEVNQPYILEISELDDLQVKNGTQRSELELPLQIEVVLSNGETIDLGVTWNDGEPLYDGTRAGSYQFTGVVQQLTGILNLYNVQAIQTVIVSEKDDPIERDQDLDPDPDPVDPIPDGDKPTIKDQEFVRRDNEDNRLPSFNEDNDTLPKTATPYFSFLVIGLFLVLASKVMLLWKRKQRMGSKQE
ncbi:Ig-like domain-containing protein [Bacillus sp. JCM 19034]|uniref:Ig-like domain-containing protein n=1 Tax=Bacillus sp. JCM 19034 TaxID=1481928 RepID=UPI0007861FA2|nr:Ig-like domain-containing protein [Bacillus sp. JCM 19034]